MNGETEAGPREQTRAGLRSALAAVFASGLIVGGIVAFSTGDDGTSVSLTSPTSISIEAPGSSAITDPVGSSASPDTVVDSASASIDDSVETDATASPDATATDPTTQTDGTSTGTDGTTAPPSSVPTETTTPAGTTQIPAGIGVPAVNATAFAVYDSSAQRYLAGNQADAPLAVGSIMKLLTSYVVLHAGDLTKVVTVPQLEVDIEESSIGLYAGEQLPRDVLFRAMMIVSANDAARTLALDIGNGDMPAFVAVMNAAAQQLGLTNTVAANPIGLDADGAHSSARDVIDLAAVLMQDPTFRAAVSKTTARLHNQTFSNTNKLLTSYPGADGIKTGHTTQAGYCLVASATRNDRTIIVSILNSPTEDQRFLDAAALLDWAFLQP